MIPGRLAPSPSDYWEQLHLEGGALASFLLGSKSVWQNLRSRKTRQRSHFILGFRPRKQNNFFRKVKTEKKTLESEGTPNPKDYWHFTCGSWMVDLNGDLFPKVWGWGSVTVSAVPTGPGMAGMWAPRSPGLVLILTGIDSGFPAFCHGILVAGHPRGFQDLRVHVV